MINRYMIDKQRVQFVNRTCCALIQLNVEGQLKTKSKVGLI